MKAIRVHQTGGPEVLKLEDVPDLKPGPRQVVVKMKAVGVNPVETYIRAGKYPLPSGMPYTPGADGAGTVASVGAGAGRFKAGDRVYVIGAVSGTYAEAALCDEAEVYPLAAGLSFAQGAAIGVPYGTAWRAMFLRGKAKAGQTVLVHGASGGVGIAAVQLGKAAGITIFGTAGSDKGMALVKDQGADLVVNHKDTHYVKQIMDATGGRGVDVILEMLANVNLGADLGILSQSGCVVVIGCRGSAEIDPRQTMGKDLDIRGMSLRNADAAELAMIHASLGAGFANGTLKPIINKELKLGEAPKAHELVMKEGAHGKIVLTA